MNTTAEVTLPLDYQYPITYNQPELMREMLPVLKATAGEENVVVDVGEKTTRNNRSKAI